MSFRQWPGRTTSEAAAVEAALRTQGIVLGVAGPDVIAVWNERAHDIAFAEDSFLTFKGQRALAMMHLAMHDALNSIVPVYERYAYTGPPPIAHPVAAVAQGAYECSSPNTRASNPSWRPSSPSGSDGCRTARFETAASRSAERRRPLSWRSGQAMASTCLAPTSFGAGPASTRRRRPGMASWRSPGFGLRRPFVLEFQRQFRPPPPPPLTSRAYARAFQEIKEFGSAASTRRTDDQTAYAIWWMEFAEGSVNRLARQLAAGHGVHLWTAARLFAHIGMALFDTYVAIWDSKYEYNHWRPYTAIRAADADDNPRTTPDPAWEPLRPAPPHPEYASAHATACAASFGILERALGRKLSFTMETTTAPPGMPTRSFESFDAAAAECADSRVRLGFHYRYATDAGLALGRQIATHTVRHSLAPRRGHGRKEREQPR